MKTISLKRYDPQNAVGGRAMREALRFQDFYDWVLECAGYRFACLCKEDGYFNKEREK